MTFKISNYEVTILAKKIGNKYYNAADTANFLTRLAVMAWGARDDSEAKGYAATANEYCEWAERLGDVVTILEEDLYA